MEFRFSWLVLFILGPLMAVGCGDGDEEDGTVDGPSATNTISNVDAEAASDAASPDSESAPAAPGDAGADESAPGAEDADVSSETGPGAEDASGLASPGDAMDPAANAGTSDSDDSTADDSNADDSAADDSTADDSNSDDSTSDDSNADNSTSGDAGSDATDPSPDTETTPAALDAECAELAFDGFGEAGGVCGDDQPEDHFYGMSAESMTHYGDMVPLCCYTGQVLLVVNIAALCGYTPQYEGIQALQERFADRGFTVLGFLSNDFGNQGGTRDQIAEVCGRDGFALSFEQFLHVGVTPDSSVGQHPVFEWLTSQQGLEGPVPWNFNKFLVSRDGRLLARWTQTTSPDDETFIAAIEAALDEGGDDNE